MIQCYCLDFFLRSVGDGVLLYPLNVVQVFYLYI